MCLLTHLTLIEIYYLDCFVLGVHLDNSILSALVSMKNLPMKHCPPADAVLLGVVHEMAAVCWHCVTVFDDSHPVVDNTLDDHKCIFDRTVASAAGVLAVDILCLHLNLCVSELDALLFFVTVRN